MTQPIPWFLSHVRAQLGQQENPLGSNRNPYGKRYGEDGVSWCVEFGWDMYADAGVVWPVKTPACVVIYDEMARRGKRVDSTSAVPGDAIIRTWERKGRQTLDPERTHFQIVVGVTNQGTKKILNLIGGNQGPGVVSEDQVVAGDATVLGALQFSAAFSARQPTGKTDTSGGNLPSPKSHPTPTALLSLGSHGPLVATLQRSLQAHGFYRGYGIDGDFGPHTFAAVYAFQKHYWPKTPGEWDGQAGPHTFHALGLS